MANICKTQCVLRGVERIVITLETIFTSHASRARTAAQCEQTQLSLSTLCSWERITYAEMCVCCRSDAFLFIMLKDSERRLRAGLKPKAKTRMWMILL